MKKVIAINNSERGFHSRWIAYCKENYIPYKLVDCYANDIIEQLQDCYALMWHFHQYSAKDIVMAKALLFALEQTGIKVFPNFNTAWHFDDKIGQKYLLNRLGIHMAQTWVFYLRKEAESWVNKAEFPIVFKLRNGAGSKNVHLVKTRNQAIRIIRRSFERGYHTYDAFRWFSDKVILWRQKKIGISVVLKGLYRLFKTPEYVRALGKQYKYVYFQEFIPNNDSDVRVVVIDGKAFAGRRMVRPNDFRASGSGISYEKRNFIDENCVELSFQYARRLNAQCVAFDFVFDQLKQPVLLEISYGYGNDSFLHDGYWDDNLVFHEGRFDACGWMVDMMLRGMNK